MFFCWFILPTLLHNAMRNSGRFFQIYIPPKIIVRSACVCLLCFRRSQNMVLKLVWNLKLWIWWNLGRKPLTFEWRDNWWPFLYSCSRCILIIVLINWELVELFCCFVCTVTVCMSHHCPVNNGSIGLLLLLFSATHFYRAMLCIRGTSHGPVSVSVCLSQVGVLLNG